MYFPLGGNRRHVYRNILCTFLASALLLHTGFLGSPWLGVDPAQLRDWLLYFALQGLLVCGGLLVADAAVLGAAVRRLALALARGRAGRSRW